jgi:hypothetical protein
VFMRARWYSMYASRFVLPDPIPDGVGTGIGYARYDYGQGNPLRYNDPSGHCIPCLVGSLIGTWIRGQIDAAQASRTFDPIITYATPFVPTVTFLQPTPATAPASEPTAMPTPSPTQMPTDAPTQTPAPTTQPIALPTQPSPATVDAGGSRNFRLPIAQPLYDNGFFADRTHDGYDMRSAMGDRAVTAMASGSVIDSDLAAGAVGSKGSYHLWVLSDNVIIEYTHLDGSVNFAPGDTIIEGQSMGNYAQVGHSNYAHLHISFVSAKDYKTYLDPRHYWPGGRPNQWTGYGTAGEGDK